MLLSMVEGRGRGRIRKKVLQNDGIPMAIKCSIFSIKPTKLAHKIRLKSVKEIYNIKFTLNHIRKSK
jgi:hypothetical protein